jgi:hypothetical protein
MTANSAYGFVERCAQAGGGWKIEGLRKKEWRDGSVTARTDGATTRSGTDVPKAHHWSKPLTSAVAVETGRGVRLEQVAPAHGTRRKGAGLPSESIASSKSAVEIGPPAMSWSRRCTSRRRSVCELTRWLHPASAVRGAMNAQTPSAISTLVLHRARLFRSANFMAALPSDRIE